VESVGVVEVLRELGVEASRVEPLQVDVDGNSVWRVDVDGGSLVLRRYHA
jgi:hypothetical protein